MTVLCAAVDLPEASSKGFEVDLGDKVVNIFVVCKDGQFFGYLNQCPHLGVNLDWQPDDFLDLDKAFIQCSSHDALFEIDTGKCVAGPCVGDALKPVTVVIENENVVLKAL